MSLFKRAVQDAKSILMDKFGSIKRAIFEVIDRDCIRLVNYLSNAELNDIETGGKTINVQSKIDAAYARAKQTKRKLLLPAGDILVTCWDVGFNGDGLVVEGQGLGTRLHGAGNVGDTIRCILKNDASSLKNATFRNFSIDTTLLPDTINSTGILLGKTWGNTFSQVQVFATGVNKSTVHLKAGCYTTTFDNCELGSIAGIVKIRGLTLSDAVTTVNFINGTALACLDIDFGFSINANGAVFQGTKTKLKARNSIGINVFFCDLESSGGVQDAGTCIFDVDSTVNHFNTMGNETAGMKTGTTYMPVKPSSGVVLDINGNFSPEIIGAANGILKMNGVVNMTSAANAGMRATQENNNAVQVDQEYKNANGSSYFGRTSGGETFIDARGAAAALNFAVAGAKKIGTTTANNLYIGTATANTATAGALGTLPAMHAGFYIVTDATGTYKIPRFAV